MFGVAEHSFCIGEVYNAHMENKNTACTCHYVVVTIRRLFSKGRPIFVNESCVILRLQSFCV